MRHLARRADAFPQASHHEGIVHRHAHDLVTPLALIFAASPTNPGRCFIDTSG